MTPRCTWGRCERVAAWLATSGQFGDPAIAAYSEALACEDHKRQVGERTSRRAFAQPVTYTSMAPAPELPGQLLLFS